MKTAISSVLIAGLCVLSGSVLSGQEGGTQTNKPTPPTPMAPEGPEVKKPAPSDIPVPAVPKDLPAEEPVAPAETSETKAYNSDDPAALKRQVDELNKRILDLERTVTALKSQVQKNEDYAKATLSDAVAKLTTAAEGVKMLSDEMSDIRTGLKAVRTDLGTTNDEQRRIAGLAGDNLKQLEQLKADLTDATHDMEIALSQVARWDENAQKWIRVAGKATMTVNGKRQAAQFAPTTQGKLVIINTDPDRERILYINGTPWLTRVGRSYVLVPVGDVSISTSRDNPQFLRKWTMNEDTGMMEARYEF